MAAVKARRSARVADFDAQEGRVRSRLDRLSERRDSVHRINVREALADREQTREYAATFGGATVGSGVTAPGLTDGIHIFRPDAELETDEWLLLAGVNHVLAALAYADVTSEYTPMDETVGTRLILVRAGRAIAYLVVLDRDGDGEPDGLLHVWVAGHHRGRGVGRALVAAARARWPITSIVGPLNTVRGAAKVAAKLAPDLRVIGQLDA